MRSQSIMGNKWKAPGGAQERETESGGGFLIVGRVFGKLNWDSCGRDVPPTAGVSSGWMQISWEMHSAFRCSPVRWSQ